MSVPVKISLSFYEKTTAEKRKGMKDEFWKKRVVSCAFIASSTYSCIYMVLEIKRERRVRGNHNRIIFSFSYHSRALTYMAFYDTALGHKRLLWRFHSFNSVINASATQNPFHLSHPTCTLWQHSHLHLRPTSTYMSFHILYLMTSKCKTSYTHSPFYHGLKKHTKDNFKPTILLPTTLDAFCI